MGVFILGILCCCGSIFGVVDILLFLGDFSFKSLALMTYALCGIPPSITFLMLLKSNNNMNRWLFATWFLIGEVCGLAAYVAFSILSGSLFTPIIVGVVGLLIVYYLYLVLKSYASKVDGLQAFLLS